MHFIQLFISMASFTLHFTFLCSSVSMVNVYRRVMCALLRPLPPLSLYRLSRNYSLPSSTQNGLLPLTHHCRAESSCDDRVWTRLTLVIWTLELCQAALEGSWSDWKGPSWGVSEGLQPIARWLFICLFPGNLLHIPQFFPCLLHFLIKDKTNYCIFPAGGRMAVFNHPVVKLNHTSLSPGTQFLIYSSRHAWRVYVNYNLHLLPTPPHQR